MRFGMNLPEIESPDDRLLRLESFLLRQVQRSLEPNRLITFAVHQLQHSPQFLAIRDLASMIGITQKHLISQFEKVVGLRPKSFARVCKFQKVVNLIEQQNQIEWSAIALDCGYYDQAHFIKEFHSLLWTQSFRLTSPNAATTSTSSPSISQTTCQG